MESDSAQGPSTIITMAPYEPSYGKEKRRKYKLDPTLVHFDHIFGNNNWSRFLVLKTEGKISPSVLENKLLGLCPTREMSFRAQNQNEWLIEATTKAQSDIFLNVKDINGIKASIKSHDMLNYIQGTVVLPQMENETDLPDKNLLIESLKYRYNNVHDLELYQIPNRTDHNKVTNIAKVKFTGQELPMKIKVLGQNREVRPYVPKPLQCKQCCKFGHTQKKCTNKAICVVCGSEDHPTNWKCPNIKCSNCGQTHHARSKECVFYLYNTELKLLMNRTGMAAREAKLELKVRGILDPARSPTYRKVLKDRASQLPRDDPKTPNQGKPKPHNNNDDEIETKLDEMFEGAESENRFSVLEEKETPESVLEEKETLENDEKTENVNERKNNKRTIERTPPRSKKAHNQNTSKTNPAVKTKLSKEKEINKTKAIGKPENLDKAKSFPPPNNENFIHEQATPLEQIKDQGEVTPSPIIGNPYPRQVSPFEPERDHGDNCGCHECFTNTYKREKCSTKESLTQIINNFIKYRKTKTTKLETHNKGCMCVDHLAHYKETNAQVLEKFVEKKITTSHNESNSRKNTPTNHGNLTTQK